MDGRLCWATEIDVGARLDLRALGLTYMVEAVTPLPHCPQSLRRLFKMQRQFHVVEHHARV